MTWTAGRLNGGLGNRLFQHAAAAGLAEKRGQKPVFFLPQCNATGHGAFNNIFKLFPDVEVLDTAPEWLSVSEEDRTLYKYQPLPVEPRDKPIVVSGWRQTEKYFPSTGIRANFVAALGSEKVAALREFIPNPQSTWFVHVRLGDYKNLKHHQVDLTEYYKKCCVQIPRGSLLILFSDEPHLCSPFFKSVAEQLGLSFSICPSKDELEGLYLMSLCLGGAIIANSTYSWWGAYFSHQNGCQKLFYPSNWGSGLPPPDDLIPSWGTRVET